MALSLGVAVGNKISVGQSLIRVDQIDEGTKVHITVDDKSSFIIDDSERQEILPNVFVSCGLSSASRGGNFSRLAFEAPFHIKINRIKKPNA